MFCDRLWYFATKVKLQNKCIGLRSQRCGRSYLPLGMLHKRKVIPVHVMKAYNVIEV